MRAIFDLILVSASLFFWRKYKHKDFLWLAIIVFVAVVAGFLKNFIYNSPQISIEIKLISSRISIVFSLIILILVLRIAYKYFWKRRSKI